MICDAGSCTQAGEQEEAEEVGELICCPSNVNPLASEEALIGALIARAEEPNTSNSAGLE